MLRPFVVAALATLALASPARAVLILSAGEWNVAPGPNVQIPIRIESGDPIDVAGMTLIVQIGDGGPELEPVVGGPRTDGPAIVGLDLLAPGALFTGNNTAPIVVDNYPQLRSVQIVTASGVVGAGPDSLLAMLTLDATGFAGQSFALSLGGTLAGDTQLNAANGQPIALQIAAGMIHVSGMPAMPDLNMDGKVDIFDVAIVSNNWANSGAPGTVTGDANKDGVVDIFDVALISNNWNPGNASAVPEPSALALAFISAAVLGALCAVRRAAAGG